MLSAQKAERLLSDSNKLLEDMGDLKGDYGDYMTTEPINCDIELKYLPTEIMSLPLRC